MAEPPGLDNTRSRGALQGLGLTQKADGSEGLLYAVAAVVDDVVDEADHLG